MKRLLFAAALLAMQHSYAIEKYWVGDAGSSWLNNAAWSPVGVPGTNDDVIFNTNAYVLFTANVTGVRSLTITNNSIVEFESAAAYKLGNSVGAPLIVASGSILRIRGSVIANSGIDLQLDGQSTIDGLVDLQGGANSRITLNSSVISTARLTVNGKIRTGALIIGGNNADAGALSGTSTSAGIRFNNGSEYEIARNTGIVGLPQAVWQPQALLKVTGAASPGGFQLALNGANPHRLGSILWNCPGQLAPCNLGFGTFPYVDTIKGTFTVQHTGGNILRFTSSNTNAFTTVFKDDFTVSSPGVQFEMFSSTATAGSANGVWIFEKNVSILPQLGMGNNTSSQHQFQFKGSATGAGGSGAQLFGANLVNTGVISLVVNNNTKGVQLIRDIAGIKDLNLTSGHIILGPYHLSAGNNDGLIYGGSSWVVTNGLGTLSLPVPTTGRPFPVGSSNLSYDPVTIVPTAAGNFTVRVDDTFSVAPVEPTWVFDRQWYVNSQVASATLQFLPDPTYATYPVVSGTDVVASLENGVWVETPTPGGYYANFSTPYTSYAVGVQGGFVVNTTITYTFIGNGNWSDPANWLNNQVPPATVENNGRVVVDPDPAGSCILDVPVTFSQGATLTVMEGKNFVVNGNLTIQ